MAQDQAVLGPRVLVGGDFQAWQPEWSPNGRRIAFVADRNQEFTLGAASVLFTSNRAGSFNIYELDLASGGVTACDAGPHSDQNARPLPGR